jgi:hypothetical protein
MQNDFEAVHTVTDYYDSPRRGIADFHGRPHAYQSLWDNSEDDWSDAFLLQPIDDETFRLAMEDWEIWNRWKSAFDNGRSQLKHIRRYQPIVTGMTRSQPSSSLVCRLTRSERFECEADSPCERHRSLVAVPPESGLSVG